MADIILKGQSGSAVYSSDLTATTNDVLSGATYIGADTDEEIGIGSIPQIGERTFVAQTGNADRVISSGSYLSGKQTISSISTEYIQASNIKKGAVVKIGDSANSGRITSITGTYTNLPSTSGSPITANKILSGYIGFVNGSSAITGTIPSKGATTITPGTGNQTIASGYYLSGTQTIKGDANLIASNIRAGIKIFNTTGIKQPETEGLVTGMTFNGYILTGTSDELDVGWTKTVAKSGNLYASSTGAIAFEYFRQRG